MSTSRNWFTAEKQGAFLEAIRTGDNIKAACGQVGVHVQTIFSRRAKDAEFKAALIAAQIAGKAAKRRGNAVAPSEPSVTPSPAPAARPDAMPAQLAALEARGIRPRAVGFVDRQGTLFMEVGQIAGFIAEAIAAAEARRAASHAQE